MTSSIYGASAEYALHSLLVLATQAEPVSVSDLATYQKLPERFLAKVFSRLRGAGLVRGAEGIAGGFVLARPAGEMTVSEILRAVDPGRSLFACAEIRRNCAVYEEAPPAWAVTGPCRIHAFMQEAERQLAEILASKTLGDLLCEFKCKVPATFAADSETWFSKRKESRSAPRKRPPK